MIKALTIHIKDYPMLKENYTRGILRNVASGAIAEKKIEPVKPPAAKKNRFINYEQKSYDYEVLEHLERLKLTGELTEEKIAELRTDERYRRYLGG